MNSKLLGGILLMIGTTIGAGMLAMPVATAQLGFWGSMGLLIGCWALLTACAFLFLEVNLWFPPNSNLISMAGATLGRPGQVVAWVFYLLLLYSILCAYISGGGDLFHYLLAKYLQLPIWASCILFTALFGIVVYFGIRAVDYVNRGLMFGKLGALLLLIAFIMPFVSPAYLDVGELKQLFAPTTISVITVAFASLMIIPSLRTYFEDDIRSLRLTIFFGTFIPLLCYIAWDMVILGVVPLEGEHGMRSMLHSATSNSDLLATLTTMLHKDSITFLAKFFTSICMATSFLSIALSLSDFLADGLKIEKKGKGNIVIFGATFIPPIAVVLIYPDAFIQGLKYAGLSCFILMIALPPVMAWAGRYHCGLANGQIYRVQGGKYLLGLLMVFATLMLGLGIEGVV
jgi:tyrosine-specific transport protein